MGFVDLTLVLSVAFEEGSVTLGLVELAVTFKGIVTLSGLVILEVAVSVVFVLLFEGKLGDVILIVEFYVALVKGIVIFGFDELTVVLLVVLVEG